MCPRLTVKVRKTTLSLKSRSLRGVGSTFKVGDHLTVTNQGIPSPTQIFVNLFSLYIIVIPKIVQQQNMQNPFPQ